MPEHKLDLGIHAPEVKMEKRRLGRTGIEVTRLGFGLAEISRQEQHGGDTSDAARVLDLALDLGINFLDTAACYASTEALIGSVASHRRDEFFLASKCGHAVDTEAEPWTAEVIAESVDRSLRRLRTDYLDILQLHSCNLEVLERGEVIEALSALATRVRPGSSGTAATTRLPCGLWGAGYSTRFRRASAWWTRAPE